MAIKANLTLDQGTDFSAVIDLTDTDGNPYNLLGFTVASQMRKNYASRTAFEFTTQSSGATGRISLSMPNTVTQDIDPGRYLYDVEITSSGGTITRVVEGVVTVNPGITRVIEVANNDPDGV